MPLLVVLASAIGTALGLLVEQFGIESVAQQAVTAVDRPERHDEVRERGLSNKAIMAKGIQIGPGIKRNSRRNQRRRHGEADDVAAWAPGPTRSFPYPVLIPVGERLPQEVSASTEESSGGVCSAMASRIVPGTARLHRCLERASVGAR